MNLRLANWEESLDKKAADEYNALRRSLLRKDGFGLFFVRCSPVVGETIIEKVKQDIPQKKIKVLRLKKSIDNLYDLIENKADNEKIDILFISGLEHSLYEYEKNKFSDNSYERYSYSWRGIPRILGYLNLQRELFRDDFKFSFVFLIPSFAINYFINRAPDFFDWRSGLFEFIPNQKIINQINFDNFSQCTPEQCKWEILELEAIAKERDLTTEERANLAYKQFLFSMKSEEYENAIEYIDQYLEFNSNDRVWTLRGLALVRLERFEQAIASYDKAIELEPDNERAWIELGFALVQLERLEEAIASYDKAIELKPDNYEAWIRRGLVLGKLERLEEEIESYDKAIELKPDDAQTWFYRGITLVQLGRSSEAIESYDKAIQYKYQR